MDSAELGGCTPYLAQGKDILVACPIARPVVYGRRSCDPRFFRRADDHGLFFRYSPMALAASMA